MYALFSAGLMFPMTVGITPLYLMIRNLGLSNSLAGIILPQIAFGLPQTIIILVPFLQSIPMELEEACLLDGCSRLGFFWRMVIPLSMPGVATTGILTFVGSWNGYMLPLFVLSDESKYTLPLGVADVQLPALGGYGQGPGVHLARHASGPHLLHDLPEEDRGWPDRRGQGLIRPVACNARSAAARAQPGRRFLKEIVMKIENPVRPDSTPIRR